MKYHTSQNWLITALCCNLREQWLVRGCRNSFSIEKVDFYPTPAEETQQERRLSMAEQAELLAAELEEQAADEARAEELELRRQRLESIQKAQETSELREKTCEEIIDEYEQAIKNYMEGKGSPEDYNRFNNDPFFLDCFNLNKINNERIRELRAELRKFNRNKQNG